MWVSGMLSLQLRMLIAVRSLAQSRGRMHSRFSKGGWGRLKNSPGGYASGNSERPILSLILRVVMKMLPAKKIWNRQPIPLGASLVPGASALLPKNTTQLCADWCVLDR